MPKMIKLVWDGGQFQTHLGFRGDTYTDSTDWKMPGEASSRQTGDKGSIACLVGNDDLSSSQGVDWI